MYLLLNFFCLFLAAVGLFSTSCVASSTKITSQQELHDSIKSKLEEAHIRHSEVLASIYKYLDRFSQFPKGLELSLLRTDLSPLLEFNNNIDLGQLFKEILDNPTISAANLVNVLLQIEWIIWLHTVWIKGGKEKSKQNFEFWVNLKADTLTQCKKSSPLIYVMFRRFFSVDALVAFDELPELKSRNNILESAEEEDQFEPQDAFLALRRIVQGSNGADSKSISCSFSLLTLIYAANLKYYFSTDRTNYLFTLHQFVKTCSFNGFDISNCQIFVEHLVPGRCQIIGHMYLAFGSKISRCFMRFFRSHLISSLPNYKKNPQHTFLHLKSNYDFSLFTKIFIELPNETLKFAFLRNFAMIYIFDCKINDIFFKSETSRYFDSYLNSNGTILLEEEAAFEIIQIYLNLLPFRSYEDNFRLLFLHKLVVEKTFLIGSNEHKNRDLLHQVLWNKFGGLGRFISGCLASSNPTLSIGEVGITEINLNDYRKDRVCDPADMDPAKLNRSLLNMDSVFFFSNMVYHAKSDEFAFYHFFNLPTIFELSPVDAFDTMQKSPFVTCSQLPAKLIDENAGGYYETLSLSGYHIKTNPYQSYVDFINHHCRQYLQLLILNVGIIQHDRDMQSLVESFKDTLATEAQKEFITSIKSFGLSNGTSLDQKLSNIISVLNSSLHLTKFQSLATSFLGMLINREESKSPQSNDSIFYHLVLDFMIALTRSKKLSLNNLFYTIKETQSRFPFVVRSHRLELYSEDFQSLNIKYALFNFSLSELATLEQLDLIFLIRDFVLKDDFRPDSNLQKHSSIEFSEVFKFINVFCRERAVLDAIIQGNFKGLDANSLSPFAFLLTPFERQEFFPNSNFMRPVVFAAKNLSLLSKPDDRFNPFEFACYHSGKILAGFTSNQVKVASDIQLINSLLNFFKTDESITCAIAKFNSSQITMIQIISAIIFNNYLPDLNEIFGSDDNFFDRIFVLKLLYSGARPDPNSIPTSEEEAINQFHSFPSLDSQSKPSEEDENDNIDDEDTIIISSSDESAQEGEGQDSLVDLVVDLSRIFDEDLLIRYPLDKTSGLYIFLEQLALNEQVLSSQVLLSNILLQLEWRLFVISLSYSFLCTEHRDLLELLLFKGFELKDRILSKVKFSGLASFFSHPVSIFTCQVFNSLFTDYNFQFLVIDQIFSPFDADEALESYKTFSPPQYLRALLLSKKLVALLHASNLLTYYDNPTTRANYNYTVTIFLTRTFESGLDRLMPLLNIFIATFITGNFIVSLMSLCR